MFTIGTFLISLNMSAVYSVLLLCTLAVFIIQTASSYAHFSLIPGIYRHTRLTRSGSRVGGDNGHFGIHLPRRDCEHGGGAAHHPFRKRVV